MAVSSESTVGYIYKRRYSDRQVGDVARRAHPVMSMMRKEDGMTGAAAQWRYAIRYGNPQSVSGTFTSAQDNLANSKGVQMAATRQDSYGIIQLDGPSLRAAKDNRGAFLDLVTQETDGIIEERGDAHAHQMFSDGHGHLGKRSSISSDTVTLDTADDARNFKIGMTVVADNTEAGSSLRSGSTTVTAIDEDAGTVTLADESLLISFADSDYLFRIGDPATIVDGFAAHIPLTAPVAGSDSFRGVDRGVHTRLLSGSRVDDTSTSILENSGLVAVKIKQSSAVAGQKKKILVLNPINFWAVSRELNAKVEYMGGGKNATAMFEGFDVASPAGILRAVSDAHCPTNRGYILAMDCWYWKHLDPWIHVILDDKGGPALRVYNLDAIEIRIRSMGNVCCSMPAANGVFSI